MINKQLLNPSSIVVVGGSDDIQKPGGKVLKNLIDGHFKGSLYVVNPKMDEVQGIKSYRDVKDLPEVDCAILAIAAKFCPSTVEMLAKQKNTRAFIILSAGFSEENAEGKALEKQIVETIDSVGGFDRPELYRCIDNELQWGIHDPYTEIGSERSRFRIGLGSNGTFHYGCRYAERCKIFECIFSR